MSDVQGEARALRPLAQAVLQALEDDPQGREGVSLPRLAKCLAQSASVLLREAHTMSDAVMGGYPGPGWVRVWQTDGRWWIALVRMPSDGR